MAAEGGFANDVNAYPDVLVDRAYIKANQSPTYTNRFRVAGAKLTIDGSPQGFTAWRDRPYYKPVGNYPRAIPAMPQRPPKHVMDAVQWAAENGIQIITHSNGERASDLLIAAHRAAQARFPKAKDLRPCSSTASSCARTSSTATRRSASSRRCSRCTPSTGATGTSTTRSVRQAGMNISPTGWARKRGMIFSSHHDAPVAFPDSMRVLDATVTRRARGSGRIVGPEHRVDVITALKAMTIWPAYHHFEEKTKGSLERRQAGRLRHPRRKTRRQSSPTTIADIKVTETVKEGKTIFRLEPGTRAERGAPDISPLLVAFGGHRGVLDDGCAHDAMFRMTAFMAGGQAGR